MPPKSVLSGKQNSKASRKRKNQDNVHAAPHKRQAQSPNEAAPNPSSMSEETIEFVQNRSEDGRLVDSYCWVCHKEFRIKEHTTCIGCPRVYHIDCLKGDKFSEAQACPECQLESVGGIPFSKPLKIEMLRKMLYALTLRVKKHTEENPRIINNEINGRIFLAWPEELESPRIINEMAIDILQDKVYDQKHPYIKTAEYYSDVKWIYHNCCILYEGNVKQIKAAKLMLDDFKEELLDLEACPECYYHLFCEDSDEPDRFARLCAKPHDIIWAKLKGSQHWPAKCLKVVNGYAHVKFFGEHERSKIKIKECYFISKNHPNYKSESNPGPRTKKFTEAMKDLQQYIDAYKERYNIFKYYTMKTPYMANSAKHAKQNQKPSENSVVGETIVEDVPWLESEADVPTENLQSNREVVTIDDDDFPIQITNPVSIQLDSIQDMSIEIEEQGTDPPSIDIGTPNYDTSDAMLEIGIPSSEQVLNSEDFSIFTPELLDESAGLGSESEMSTPCPIVNAVPAVHSGSSLDPIPVEDDVLVLDHQLTQGIPCPQQNFDPSLVLPFILKQDPEMSHLYQDGQLAFNSTFVRMWARGHGGLKTPELVVRYNKLVKELKGEIESLRKSVNEERFKFEAEKKQREVVVENARMIVIGLQKKLDIAREQLNSKIADLTIKNEQLKNELVRSKSDCDKFKKDDYCRVCSKPAEIRCCWNTNYCSSKCRDRHHKDHVRNCQSSLKKDPQLQALQTTTVMQIDSVSTFVSSINSPSNMFSR